jgi:hypothetical protein
MNPSEESEHLLTNTDIAQWSCPRCTLLNPISLDECELCEFNSNNRMVLSADDSDDDIQFHRQMQDTCQQRKFMIRFEPLNPLVANNVIGSTTTIASSSLVGGLVGGPVGAIIGAAGAAVLDGANRLHHFLNQNNHPRLVLTTTRMLGSAMSITMKTSAHTRNMVVQPVWTTANGDGTSENRVDDGYWSQLTPRDLRMLQILFLHVLCDNTIRDEEVLFLSREELLERLSPPLSTTHGASPECIDQNSERIIVEDAEAISGLEEHQQVCNICLEDFKEGDNMRLLRPCSHAFHTQCIDQWLCKVASCPICKNELPIGEQAK